MNGSLFLDENQRFEADTGQMLKMRKVRENAENAADLLSCDWL